MKEGYVSDEYYQITEYVFDCRNRVVCKNIYLSEALELVKTLYSVGTQYECYNHTFIIDKQEGYNKVKE